MTQKTKTMSTENKKGMYLLVEFKKLDKRPLLRQPLIDFHGAKTISLNEEDIESIFHQYSDAYDYLHIDGFKQALTGLLNQTK